MNEIVMWLEMMVGAAQFILAGLFAVALGFFVFDHGRPGRTAEGMGAERTFPRAAA